MKIITVITPTDAKNEIVEINEDMTHAYWSEADIEGRTKFFNRLRVIASSNAPEVELDEEMTAFYRRLSRSYRKFVLEHIGS